MNIGDMFTTAKSGVTGTIAEIVPCKNGKVRLALIVLKNGSSHIKWTTVQA